MMELTMSNRILTKWFGISVMVMFLAVFGDTLMYGQEAVHTNSIGMEFVLIPAGSFTMGADKNVENALNNETPPHRVTISKPFYLGKFEVTQAQWTALMENNLSTFKGRSNPVEEVSWDDIQVFIQRLNRKEGHRRYRLPTEAEWEYAARAGTTSAFSFDDDEGNIGQYAWWSGNSGAMTHSVGQKRPNAWGLYDMHGNVWEWVQDWYDEHYYSQSPSVDPHGPSSGQHRVHRGGSWIDTAGVCRSASRHHYFSNFRDRDIGFRLAISVD
jgi:formylglycine-generating enzyme required for sulfatase activity